MVRSSNPCVANSWFVSRHLSLGSWVWMDVPDRAHFARRGLKFEPRRNPGWPSVRLDRSTMANTIVVVHRWHFCAELRSSQQLVALHSTNEWWAISVEATGIEAPGRGLRGASRVLIAQPKQLCQMGKHHMLYHADFHIEYPPSMSQKEFFSIWARRGRSSVGREEGRTGRRHLEMCRRSARDGHCQCG